MSSESENFREAIDAVAENASRQIATRRRHDVVRSLLSASVLLILVVPLLAVIAQAIRWRAGLGAGQWFSWPALVALSLAVPVLWLIAKVSSSKTGVDRLRALGAMDAALGASERMVTADQFLQSDSRDAFMQAAVEDSVEWAERGRLASFDSTAGEIRFGRSLAAIPLALLIMIAAAWMAGLAIPGDEPQGQPSDTALAAAPGTTSERREFQPRPDEEQEIASSPREQRRVKPGRSANQKNTVANVTPDGAEESRGRLTDGETSESQQTSNPSSARGEPTSQAQSSKPGGQTPRKPKKDQKPTTDRGSPERPRDKDEEPSGATAGQGSSRGSNNNAAASDWSSRSQEATPDDEDMEDEDDVEDEEVELKAVTDAETVVRLRHVVRAVPLPEHVEAEAIRIIMATQPGNQYSPGIVDEVVDLGASPRGVQGLILAGKVRALLEGRFAVAGEDLRAVAFDVLRHRVLVNFQGMSEGISPDDVIAEVLADVPTVEG